MSLCTKVHEMMDLLRSKKVEPPPHTFTTIGHVNEALDGLRKGTVSGRVIMKHDWPESKM